MRVFMTDSEKTPHLLENTVQWLDNVANRLQLINYYNFLLGAPTAAVATIQRDFVMGAMTSDEMSSFASLYQLIADHAARQERRNSD